MTGISPWAQVSSMEFEIPLLEYFSYFEAFFCHQNTFPKWQRPLQRANLDQFQLILVDLN